MPAPDLPRDELLTAAAAAHRHGPVTVIFASEPALYLLDNWLQHARRAGVHNTILIALDETVAAHQYGAGCVTVYAPFEGDFSDLWLLRLHVFEFLAGNGIDFVHSDLDAVWLGDVRPECYADASLDLVFSQGLFFPLQAYEAWKFVLCCGLFAVRANAASRHYLAEVRARWVTDRDDQIAANLVLLDNDMVWREGAERYQITIGSRSMDCYRHILHGRSNALGVSIGLLPFHRVPRLAGRSSSAVVRHPLSTRGRAERILALRQSGVWPETDPPA